MSSQSCDSPVKTVTWTIEGACDELPDMAWLASRSNHMHPSALCAPSEQHDTVLVLVLVYVRLSPYTIGGDGRD